MQLIPIATPLLRPDDDLAKILTDDVHHITEGDVVVLSSKALATVEGAYISVMPSGVEGSPSAKKYADLTGRTPEFCEAVIKEVERLNGTVIGTCPGAMLTEVKPEGLTTGTILVANAGLDESNAPKGYAIGWPRDPVKSVSALRKRLNAAVILTDSCVRPRRLGVTAFALVVSGLDPLQSLKGTEDLFGKKLRITVEAIADQLATAANFLMGNAAQSIPAVIIRDHGLTLSDWEGWVPGIEPGEDLFRGLL